MTITPDDRSFIDQGKTFLKQEWHGSYEEEQTKMFLGLILTKYEELVSSGEAASNRDSSDEDESEDDQADSKQRTQRAEDHTCDREPLGLSSLQSDNAGHDSNDAGDDAPIEQELAKPGGEEQDRKDDTGDAGSQRRRGSFGVVAEVRIAGSHARPFGDSKSQFLRPYPKPGLSPDFSLDAATGVAPQDPNECLCYGANGVTEPMCPACTAKDVREKLAEAEFKGLPVGSIVTVEEHWYGTQAAILGDTEDGPRWWTTLDAPSGNGDGYTPSTMWSYYGEEDDEGVTLIRRGSVALAAPVAVDEAKLADLQSAMEEEVNLGGNAEGLMVTVREWLGDGER